MHELGDGDVRRARIKCDRFGEREPHKEENFEFLP